jgi:hypothetical protein
MSFSRLQDLIPQAAAKRNLGNRLQVAHVFRLYRLFIADYIGEPFVALTSPKQVKDGVLWVSAGDSVLANEIFSRQMVLVEYFTERLPAAGINGVRVVQETIIEESCPV